MRYIIVALIFAALTAGMIGLGRGAHWDRAQPVYPMKVTVA